MKKLIGFVLFCFMLMTVTPVMAKNIRGIAWDPSPSEGVTGYKLCYSTDPTRLVEGQDVPTEGIIPTCLDMGMALTGEILGVADQPTHYIGVIAYNAVDMQSVLSNIVSSPGFAKPLSGTIANPGTTEVNNTEVPNQ